MRVRHKMKKKIQKNILRLHEERLERIFETQRPNMSLSLKLTIKTSGRASHALTTSPVLAPRCAPARGQLATDFRGPLALLLLRENRLLFFLGAASSAWPWLSGGGTICLMASVSCVNSSLLSHLVRAKGKGYG